MAYVEPRLKKRGNKWQIDYVSPDGRRRRLSAGRDFRMAERIRIKYANWLLDGKDPEREIERAKQAEQARSITLKEFYPIFMDRHGQRQSYNMQKLYYYNFKAICRCPQLIEIPIGQIRKKLMIDYMQARIDQDGVTPATVNREAAFICCMLNKAVEWDILDRNPLQGIKLFKEKGKRDVYISPNQAKALLDELPETLANIVEFAIYTGFRKENILSLRTKQIRFHDLTPTGEVDLVVKGDKRETFPLGRSATALIKRVIGGRQKGYVFLSPRNKMRYFSIHKTFTRAVTKLGLKAKDGSKLRFHDLRHIFATWLRDAGVSLDDIRPLMGHESRNMTDRYASINMSRVSGLLDLMPKLRE